MKMLLDTQAFIWWLANDPRLGEAAREAITGADLVMVSAASAWEAGIKSSLGLLDLGCAFADAVRDCGFEALPVTMAHAEAAGALPRHPAHPVDRMLVAQAQEESLVLLTGDERFRPYGVEILWT